MDEFTIAKKLQSLQSVKPTENWASLNKAEILTKQFEKEKTWFASAKETMSVFSGIFQTYRLAPIYASLAVVIFSTFGVVLASRQAMPGDALYTIKQTEEKIQMAMIMSPEQKTVAQVEQVSTRLDELDTVSKQAANNPSKKLAVLNETKKAVVEATKEIAKLSEDQQASLIGKLAAKIQTVEKNTNAAIMDKDEPSFESIYKFLADSEIKEFESNEENLTLKQKNLLKQAKDFFDVSKYSEALDKLYQIQPQTENLEDELKD